MRYLETVQKSFLLSLLITLAFVSCAANPRLIDEDPATGFALYRSGGLSRAELARVCEKGVREIVVMNGTAASRECVWREEVCPGLAVRYDRKQDVGIPLSAAFLESFDAWVVRAQSAGTPILVRCTHGWHRTGRLSAYYRMRFQDLPVQDALTLIHAYGHFMWWHPYLEPQVRALADYVAGRPCGTESKHCVRTDVPESGTRERFVEDACRPSPLSP